MFMQSGKASPKPNECRGTENIELHELTWCAEYESAPNDRYTKAFGRPRNRDLHAGGLDALPWEVGHGTLSAVGSAS